MDETLAENERDTGEGDDFSFVMLNAQRQLLIAVPEAHVAAGMFDYVTWPDIKRFYVAGPMRGYDRWNFPAFDAARDKLLALGIQVISPADLDRQRGITEDTTEFNPGEFKIAMAIDMWALLNCTGIFLLKGWEDSSGARQELATAQAIGLEIEFDDDAVEGQVVLSSVTTSELVA